MNNYICYELEQLEKITGYSLAHIKNDINNVYNSLEEKDKEIEQLNNIINELEEWLNDEENPKVYYDWENKCDYVYIDNLLAKIQELKESGKNE